MPEVYHRLFKVSELFDIWRGHSRYIRRYYADHAGPYPVYSASANPTQVHGYVDDYDFEGDCLTWTTNGYAGYVFVRNGKFCATRDVGVLKPREEHRDHISLDFFAPVLTKVLKEAATGRRRETGESDYTKIAGKSAAGVEVMIPVRSDGKPHLPFQLEVAARFRVVEGVKSGLASLLAEFNRRRIAFAHVASTLKPFRVADLFEISRGDSSLTQKYIREHRGDYPVFSGSSFRNQTAGHIDRFDFDGEYLTWAADGYAGVVYARSGKFSANSHAGIMRPRESVAARLHLPYFEYALSPVLESLAVGRVRENGSPDYTRVTIGMVNDAFVDVPTSPDGLPDLGAQRASVERIAPLEREKLAIEDELTRLVNAEVDSDWLTGLEKWPDAR
jgi:hypothetical protein